MAFLQPKKWHQWLALAECWYNASFHTSLGKTPFQAMYGGVPPQLAESLLLVDDASPTLIPNTTVQDIALQIKANLQKAQDRMKVQADKHKQERQRELGASSI
jgi:hypothetical protein